MVWLPFHTVYLVYTTDHMLQRLLDPWPKSDWSHVIGQILTLCLNVCWSLKTGAIHSLKLPFKFCTGIFYKGLGMPQPTMILATREIHRIQTLYICYRQSCHVLVSAVSYSCIISYYKFVTSNINYHVMEILVLCIMPNSLIRRWCL